ncbi:MBL fold metallo-hydrolase [bacterium]|nr:MBL fold metallo-hydrolase [bacterium]
MKNLDIEILQLGMLETNCYIVSDTEGGECAVVDPADDAAYIVSVAEKSGMRIATIILTHGHYDHIGALASLAGATGCRAHIHPRDAAKLTDTGRNFSSLLGSPAVYTGEITPVEDGDLISVGTRNLRVIHTPGHSPGSICLSGDDFILSGDTLFASGVGRTDLPGGSPEQLTRSIRDKLFALPDATVVFPGHGSPTTIGKEKAENPFFH